MPRRFIFIYHVNYLMTARLSISFEIETAEEDEEYFFIQHATTISSKMRDARQALMTSNSQRNAKHFPLDAKYIAPLKCAYTEILLAISLMRIISFDDILGTNGEEEEAEGEKGRAYHSQPPELKSHSLDLLGRFS